MTEKINENTEIEINEVIESQNTSKIDEKARFLKVILPQKNSELVYNALQVLKERKSEYKIEDLLKDHLEKITEDYLKKKCDELTPEDYYLTLALTNSDLKKILTEQAKKLLQKQNQSMSMDMNDQNVDVKLGLKVESKKKNKSQNHLISSISN